MKEVKYIVFRYLTQAEYFNIYKPSGTEERGGGQVYIDFPTTSIPLKYWKKYFDGAPKVVISSAAQGPRWIFNINSIGITGSQRLTIYQRRKQSICIAAQRITSRSENRVNAWRPSNGFPEPANPKDRHSLPNNLAIYLVRTKDDEFWAGWFQASPPCKDKPSSELLNIMTTNKGVEGYAGFLDFSTINLLFDTDNKEKPFQAISSLMSPVIVPREKHPKSEEDITNELLEEDELDSSELPVKTRQVVLNIRERDQKAVKQLKNLYKGKCQISGDMFSFFKKDGKRYSEAHHLVPLGKSGADSPFNIIIVSPLIHRMLHY